MTDGIMLIGVGDLGNHILNFLARTPGVREIIAADANERAAIVKVRMAKYGAYHQGFYPRIDFLKLDLRDVEHVSNILKETRPKVICLAVTVYPLYLHHAPSKESYEKVRAKYGGDACHWALPAYLPMKLMQAVKRSGIDTQIVQGTAADMVNPMLKGMGLLRSGWCGAGNIALATGFIKEVVSNDLSVPVSDIRLFLVCDHAWIEWLAGAGSPNKRIPYWLKILAGADDVTGRFPPEKLYRELERISKDYDLSMQGPLGEASRYHVQWIASSFVQNTLGIYFDTQELSHSPGVNGLPGGYPVRLSAKGAEVYVPEGMTLDEMVKINMDGWREAGRTGTGVWPLIGQDRVEPDGTLVHMDGSSLKPQDIEKTALDLLSMLTSQ